jgi:nitroreductase
LSVQALETTAREDAANVVAFYERTTEAEAGAEAATILVAQADGQGVPMVQPTPEARPVRPGKGAPPNRMREAVVTALYTIEPFPRTPEAVAAALLRDPDRPSRERRPRPVRKELRATLDGKAVALARLADRALRRDGPWIVDRVALTDGAHALQDQMRAALPGHTLVLDIIHAVEYLWIAANALLGERHPDRTAWVRARLLGVLRGQVDEVVAALTIEAAAPDLAATKRDAVAATIAYYRRNAPCMRYDRYLARGWPIGTGVIESACGHLVKDRLQQAGMRWTKDGAHAILDLRAIRLANDWDAYWAFHRQHQHRHLYGSSPVPVAPPEAQALAHAHAA